MRGTILFCAAVLWAFNSAAEYGRVELADGKKLEGEIQLEKGKISITPTNAVEDEAAAVRVDLAILVLVQFQPASSVSAKTSPTNSVHAATPAQPATPKLSAGVLLTGGSIIARRIASADDTSVRLLGSTNETPLSTVNVARLIFQPLPAEAEERITSGRAGVLLSSKEFVESEFKGYSNGQIKMSSVLYGFKSYDPGQVLTVVLRASKPALTRYQLKTRDQSLFLVDSLRIENGAILLQDSALAGFRIPAAEILELKRLSKPKD
jgi:hypothetical protein